MAHVRCRIVPECCSFWWFAGLAVLPQSPGSGVVQLAFQESEAAQEVVEIANHFSTLCE